MNIEGLTDPKRETLGIKQSGGILMTDGAEPDSFAAEIGLLPNDVVLSINRQPVNSPADVAAHRSYFTGGRAGVLSACCARPNTANGRRCTWPA